MNGYFSINKPIGITSHDVISKLRRVTGEKTIGHAGTLDPVASGLLIVAIGREYTKNIRQFVGLSKEYEAEILLGKSSTTYDSEGQLTDISSMIPTSEDVLGVLRQFVGKLQQIPPAYSAKKIKGKKAYELARQGREFELKAVSVEIYNIDLENYSYPRLTIKTLVSSGTYIRSLANDIGEALGTGAYLSQLKRTRIGEFHVSSAVDLEKIKTAEDLLPFSIV